MTATPVPFDPEVAAALETIAGMMPPFDVHAIVAQRDVAYPYPPLADVIGQRVVEFEERRIPGPAGDIEITLIRPEATAGPAACLVNFHGGGMVAGHRYMDNQRLVDLVHTLGVVAVNVEYRLAPEHPFPAGVEDCYAALAWVSAGAADIGVDPTRIAVMGGSAGGGLSAAVALMARDRGGPALAAQLLLCPMIDDRPSQSPSRVQYADLGTWPGTANVQGWGALLGESLGGQDVSPYAAPARASDLSGLPPAFVEVGAAELFRDEDVDYASRIWVAGGSAELHVWAGGCHGFDIFAPKAAVSAAALDSRRSWLRRVLALG